MPAFRLPLSGNVTQSINPWTWLFNPVGSQIGLVNIELGQSSNPAVEEEVLSDVASYGKQLGIITDVVLELAGDKPPKDEHPLAQLREIAAKVRKLKEEHERSLAKQASDAMAKLAKTDEAEARRIARDYAGKTSG